MSSYLVQIHEGRRAPKELRAGVWVLWTNCRSIDECRRLALHRHIRIRGGVTQPFTVRVYISKATDIGPDGVPHSAHMTEYNVYPDYEEPPPAPYDVNWARDRRKGAQGDW